MGSIPLGAYYSNNPVRYIVLLLAFLQPTELLSQNLAFSNQQIDSLLAVIDQKLRTSPDSAFVMAQNAKRKAEANHYRLGIAGALQVMGEVFFHQGIYTEALHLLLESEKLYHEIGAQAKMAENQNQLGLVYYNLHQPEVSLQKHSEALKLYESISDHGGIAYTYGCLGHLHEKKQEYDEALRFQRQALAYYEKGNDFRGKATILENIGSVHEDLGQLDLANDFYQRSLQLNTIAGDSLAVANLFNNIADCYRKTGKMDEAIQYANRALTLALRLRDKYQIVSAYKDLSKTYYQAGTYKDAYENLEKGRTLYEEMYGEETRQQATLLQTLFEVERKNGEIHVLESEKQLSNVIRAALIIGISLLVVLAMVVISRQRLKIKQDKGIIHKTESQQKLMQTELENAHLHEKKLQDELENRSKSLTAHTLHIITKNKMLDEIRSKLQDALKEEAKNHRKKISGLIKLIDHNFVQDKDWQDFRNIFEQVHSDFFDQLHKACPGLTSSDLRLAALIKLNLPSKDIATILGISPDSLRISRYRLRKKFSVTQGTSLTSFIHGI